LPIAAYASSLALDDDAVYLLTSHAAYLLADLRIEPHLLRVCGGSVRSREGYGHTGSPPSPA